MISNDHNSPHFMEMTRVPSPHLSFTSFWSILPRSLAATLGCCLLVLANIQATPLYWDSNGSPAGAGPAPAGTWGTSNFWNTDTAGGAGTFSTATTAGDDLYFVAGPSGTSGNSAYAITVDSTQAANTLNFQSSGAPTFTGGTINLTGGITAADVAFGATARGVVTINSNIALQASQDFSNLNTTNAVSIGGIISDGGSNFTLTKSGAGRLILGNANSFGGGINLTAGTLDLNNAGALGSGTLTITGGTINNSTGAAIVLSTNNAQAWNGDFSFGGTRALTMGTGTITLGGDRLLGISGSATNFFRVSGVIDDGANSYSITKNGGGRLILGAANTFDGGVVLNSGQLSTGNANSLGTGVLTINGGSLVTNNLTMNNNAQIWNAGYTVATGSGSLSMGTGAVTLNASIAISVDEFQVYNVGGAISDGAGSFSLTKNGLGTMVLGGAGNYDGGLTLNAGILGLGNSSMGTGTLTINGGSIQTRGTTLNAVAQIWGGNFSVVGGSGPQNMGTGTVTLTGTRTVTTAGGQTFTVGGDIQGTGFGLVKAGTGTMILTGASTYTGPTSVGAGILRLDGSLANANLSVTGGAFNMTSTAKLRYNITGLGANDQFVLTGGTTTFDGAFELNLSQSFEAGGSWVLATGLTGTNYTALDSIFLTGDAAYTGTTLTRSAGVWSGTANNGQSVSFAEADSTLTLSAIPEASTSLLLLLGLLTLFPRRAHRSGI